MAIITLHNGMQTTVDDEDFEALSAFKWFALPCGRKTKFWYATRHKKREDGKRGPTYMHREITEAPDTRCVDHINGNTLDNRKENLRLATYSQNTANSVRAPNISGYRGVYQNHNRFAAKICVQYKMLHLGNFVDPAEAARAYDDAARLVHGEFATLNFPGEAA